MRHFRSRHFETRHLSSRALRGRVQVSHHSDGRPGVRLVNQVPGYLRRMWEDEEEALIALALKQILGR